MGAFDIVTMLLRPELIETIARRKNSRMHMCREDSCERPSCPTPAAWPAMQVEKKCILGGSEIVDRHA
jgi:hypothetical protein